MNRLFGKVLGLSIIGYISYRLYRIAQQEDKILNSRIEILDKLYSELPKIREMAQGMREYNFVGLSSFWSNAIFKLEDTSVISDENIRSAVEHLRFVLANELAKHKPGSMFDLDLAASFRKEIEDQYEQERERRAKEVLEAGKLTDSMITDVLMDSKNKIKTYLGILNSK